MSSIFLQQLVKESQDFLEAEEKAKKKARNKKKSERTARKRKKSKK